VIFRGQLEERDAETISVADRWKAIIGRDESPLPSPSLWPRRHFDGYEFTGLGIEDGHGLLPYAWYRENAPARQKIEACFHRGKQFVTG
jgi:hypothetical protein